MGYPRTANIRIPQGATYDDVRRWGIGPFVFKPITGASNEAPLVLTVVGHGLPEGWPFAIEDVKGMLRINSRKNPPVDSDYVRGSVVDGDHVSVPAINSIDFSPYEFGGVIRYATPVDLSAYSGAIFTLHDKDDPDIVFVTKTLGDGIEFDNTGKRILLKIEAAETAEFDFDCASYHFDILSAGAEVKRLFVGSAELVKK